MIRSREQKERVLARVLKEDRVFNDTSKPSRERTRALARRGSLQLAMSFSEEALADLDAAVKAMEAAAETEATDPAAYWVYAQRAEAHRLFVRDVLFNKPKSGSRIQHHLDCAVRDFERSLALLGDTKPEARAFIRAHCGAARSAIYWSSMSADNDARVCSELFHAAEADFKEALRLKKKYAWCKMSLGILYTLRGENADLSRAEKELAEAVKLSPQLEVWQNKYLGMLRSYGLNSLGKESAEEAAKAAVEFAGNDTYADPEEVRSAFDLAACLAWLRDNAPNGACYAEHLKAAIRSARTRATNATCNATMVHVGLYLIEGKQKEAEELFASIANQLPPETLLFSRSPAFFGSDIARELARLQREIIGAVYNEDGTPARPSLSTGK